MIIKAWAVKYIDYFEADYFLEDYYVHKEDAAKDASERNKQAKENQEDLLGKYDIEEVEWEIKECYNGTCNRRT